MASFVLCCGTLLRTFVQFFLVGLTCVQNFVMFGVLVKILDIKIIILRDKVKLSFSICLTSANWTLKHHPLKMKCLFLFVQAS